MSQRHKSQREFGRLSKCWTVVAALFLCVGTIAAQSGRRGTSKPTTPAPTTEPPVSAPKQIEAKPEKSNKLQLVVGVQDPNPFDNLPYYISDTILDACVARLNEAGTVTAKRAMQHMTRATAIKAAKEEKEQFVVFLQVGSDTADAGRQQSTSADSLYIMYTIFEPGTAKIKKMGRTSHG